MTAVEEFIDRYTGGQRDIMWYFHRLLVKEFGLEPRLQYNLPFYYRKSWICYLFPTKKDYIELSFTRGSELSNVQGLLRSKGRKMVWSTGFDKLSEIPEEPLRELIHEAILLDEKVPYSFPIKGRSKTGK